MLLSGLLVNARLLVGNSWTSPCRVDTLTDLADLVGCILHFKSYYSIDIFWGTHYSYSFLQARDCSEQRPCTPTAEN